MASAINEGIQILRDAIDDLVGAPAAGDTTPSLKIRVGTLAIPIETIELVDLSPAVFAAHKAQLFAIEQERYRGAALSSPDTLQTGRPSLLQYPLETLETTAANARAIGIGLRDRVSGRFIGYALGSALENHDEEGVTSDPRLGENNTFYLQAMAILPSVQNSAALENVLLDAVRERAITAGFEYLSTIIEASVQDTGPAWIRSATVLERLDNYLRSGVGFLYLQAALQPAGNPVIESAP